MALHCIYSILPLFFDIDLTLVGHAFTCEFNFASTMFLLQTFTQYIPLSICDLQMWMGVPSIYVFDCSNAGVIVNFLKANPLPPHYSETLVSYKWFQKHRFLHISHAYK